MKKQNGFIATSLLYTFFLAFIGLFIGMITIYLQNRVYLIKLEDSSKNSIYIREINELTSPFNANVNGTDTELTREEKGTYKNNSGTKYILARCETIYLENNKYYIEGCPTS